MPSSCHSSLALARANLFHAERGLLPGVGRLSPMDRIRLATVDGEGAGTLP